MQGRVALPRGRAEYGSWRAHELLNDLPQHLAGAPAEILQGHRVIEVRARGVDKGVYVRSVFPDGKESTQFVIGIGDDRTDHDLLDALPPGSVAGHVGGLLPSTRSNGGPRDHVHILGPGEVRELLREMAAAVPAEQVGGRAASWPRPAVVVSPVSWSAQSPSPPGLVAAHRRALCVITARSASVMKRIGLIRRRVRADRPVASRTGS